MQDAPYMTTQVSEANFSEMEGGHRSKIRNSLIEICSHTGFHKFSPHNRYQWYFYLDTVPD